MTSGTPIWRAAALAALLVLTSCPAFADPLMLVYEGGLYVVLDGRTYYMQPYGEMDVWLGVYWVKAPISMANCHRASGLPQVASATHLTYSQAPGAFVYLDDALAAWPMDTSFFGVQMVMFNSKTHDVVCDGEVVIPSDRLLTDGFEQ